MNENKLIYEMIKKLDNQMDKIDKRFDHLEKEISEIKTISNTIASHTSKITENHKEVMNKLDSLI